MLKAIFSLFCVAALFNSGLVLANTDRGDPAANTTAQAKNQTAVDNQDNGQVNQTLNSNGDENNNNPPQTQNQNQTQNQTPELTEEPNSNSSLIDNAGFGDTNGGNTVQVSILGMFIILVLAIFNH